MIKKNDCIKLNYSAYDAENNSLFDTTMKDVASKLGLVQEEKTYEPVEIIVGKNFIVPGVDESLIGKKIGDKYEIDVPVEKGFGKWDSKLTENIKINVFTEKKINPVRGMFVTIDNRMAKIIFVSNRLVKVDYNHPLAGKNLKYEIRIESEIKEDEKIAQCLISNLLSPDFKAKIDKESLKIKGKLELPKQFKEAIEKEIKEILKKGYKLEFEIDK